jgi:hypothetical protein
MMDPLLDRPVRDVDRLLDQVATRLAIRFPGLFSPQAVSPFIDLYSRKLIDELILTASSER